MHIHTTSLVTQRAAKKMTTYSSETTDFVYLYNSSEDTVAIYAGNETAVPPQHTQSSILIRFKTTMDVMRLGTMPSKSCIKIKMTQDSYGFMETISMPDFFTAYKKKNPRDVFKQIQPR
jgi:hypothetical protein